MGKINTLIQQHPELGKRLIDFLVEVDPSDTNKYLLFLIKHLKSNMGGSIVGKDIADTIRVFDEHLKENRILETDLTKYNSIGDFKKQIKHAENILARKKAEKEFIILNKTENEFVVIPLTSEASNIYGKGTRWCTSANGNSQFSLYTKNAVLVYVIKKNGNQEEKFAYHLTKDSVACYRSNDTPTNPFTPQLSGDVYKKMLDFVNKYDSTRNFNFIKNSDYVLLNNKNVIVTTLNKRPLQVAYSQAVKRGDEKSMNIIAVEYAKRKYKTGNIEDLVDKV